jgi:hypothetical protein
MQVITIDDYLLLPLYILFFYFIVKIKSVKYNGTPLKRFFIISFFLHVLGSVLYGMVVQYYYGYGDSFIYFDGGSFLRRAVTETGHIASVYSMNGEELSRMANTIGWGNNYLEGTLLNDSNLMLIKITGLLSYLTFNKYLVSSLFFGFFSFIGLWKLFMTFNHILENKHVKILGYAVLYFPSVWFWGSGLLKDSICFGMLGLIIYYLYKNLIQKKTAVKDFFIIITCFYLIFIIKSYIAGVLVVSFAVALIVFIISTRNSVGAKLGIAFTTIVIGILFITVTLNVYLENTLEESATMIEMSKNIYSNSETDDERSRGSFDAGDFDLSPTGILARAPAAAFTTLYRPFIWETRKPIMLLSAVESFLLLLATLFLFYKTRVYRFFLYCFGNPYIIFSFLFVIMLGAVVGLTTFNFGTIARYRVPLLPFISFLLVMIYNKINIQAARQSAE